MKCIRRWSILGLAAILLLVGGGTSAAADQVPRQWTKMSLEDVGRAPFKMGYCNVINSGTAWTMCMINASLADNRRLNFMIHLRWLESEPEADCPKLLRNCVGPREAPDGYMVRSTGRVAWATIGKPICYDALSHSAGYSRSRCEAEWEQVEAALSSQRGVVLDMLRDAVSRIELYAIPCRCGDTPIGEQAEEAPTGRPEAAVETERSGSRGSTGSTPPLPRVVKPGGDLLGQGNEAACWEGIPCNRGTESRAMRRTGGFPPDVEVAALRFFPSRDDLPPKDERAYADRFSQAIDYLNVELNLTYPEREERFPFEMEVLVRKNGEPYATFSRSMSLEPGWVDSHHSAGYGRSGGGFWATGRYEVEVTVKGAVVATGTVEVVASP